MSTSVRSRVGRGSLVSIFFGIPLVLIGLHTLSKSLRRSHKNLATNWLEETIDDPIRQKWMSPAKLVERHGIQSGMIVMEINPGSGDNAFAAAKVLGSNGRLVAVDTQDMVVEQLKAKARRSEMYNLEAHQADITELPFSDDSFDIVYMVTTIGDVLNPVRALQECRRVLSKTGTLVFSEFILDPNHPSAGMLIKLAKEAGFRLKSRSGSFWAYTLVFEKDPQMVY